MRRPRPAETETASPEPRQASLWLYDLLLICVLLAGAYLRLVGLNWGEYQYLHPDERFLVWVGSDIAPIGTTAEQIGTAPSTVTNPWRGDPRYAADYPDCAEWGGYFDASCSPLNPNNRGHAFYVYGTLPVFTARYLVEWIYGHSGFNEMTNVGRALSAAADLLTVLLVYAVGKRSYNARVGLLAAAFSALTVMQIQQAHYFTTDTFFNMFTLLAVYYAVRVSTEKVDLPFARGEAAWERGEGTGEPLAQRSNDFYPDGPIENAAPSLPNRSNDFSRYLRILRTYLRHPYFRLAVGFGVALGCAMASKLSAYPVAFMLPFAFILVWLRTPSRERDRAMWNALLYLGIAAFVSLLVFRVFQPYAFKGPGFFGLQPNPLWVANIKEQRGQAAGDIDYPPSLQWARRPVTFSGENMLLWGLGLPLGLLAVGGFVWAGWRMLRKGEYQRHILLWGWGGFYFVWQSLQFNPTMRYQLPTYPMLAIFAAWAVFALYEWGKARLTAGTWLKLAAWLVGGLVLVSTAAWAFAFSRIYDRPITRVEASYWIYQNLPGPINLHIQTEEGGFNQPLSFPYSQTLRNGWPYNISFEARASGVLSEVYLPHVVDRQRVDANVLDVSLAAQAEGAPLLASAILEVAPGASGAQSLRFTAPAQLSLDQIYTLTISVRSDQDRLDLCGALEIPITGLTETFTQSVPAPAECVVSYDQPYTVSFVLQQEGLVEGLALAQVIDLQPPGGEQTLLLTIGPTDSASLVSTARLTGGFPPGADERGDGYTLTLSEPVNLVEGQTYSLSLALEQGSGALGLQGTAIANEGEWDDGLPLRVLGYDGFGGIYTGGLNFNMYTDDGPEKLARFLEVYDSADVLIITSNRQWGSLPRLPERFPLSTLHYRLLLGCPEDKTIAWCYSVAQPGTFQGQLGFELVEVFQSDPAIGPLRINDQFAEEAFTVYDHPKVLIFRKTADYDAARVASLLSQADLDEIVRLTPKKAGTYPGNLLLPQSRLEEQQAGGTWSELFNTQALHNRFQVVGVIVWYLAITLIGWLAYPLLRLAFPGLPDHGYPLARITGMLLLAYLTWLAGSIEIPFSRLTISLVLLLLALLAAMLAYRQREALRTELRLHWKYFLIIEGLALLFFLTFLFVRLGNPDLWHMWKGGEKPMDFSYFNAVLRSTTFPPYDPWYAGGYLNYYYWGFVLVGVPVKWLGLVPSFAYNLILPTLFSLVGLGAFSLAFNLASHRSERGRTPTSDQLSTDHSALLTEHSSLTPFPLIPYLIGLAGALGTTVLGNLGTLRMILRGYATLGLEGINISDASLFEKLLALLPGLYKVAVGGQSLPYGLGDWYWIPSRAIIAPGDVEPITEFPMFTFLYADLHAHMVALPLALLALSWALAVVLGKGRWSGPLAGGLAFLLGGLAIGALYPTNLSDMYTYLPLGLAALAYAWARYARVPVYAWSERLPGFVRRLLVILGGALALTLLSFWLFQPYRDWYGQAYSEIMPWFGTHTPLSDYLVHWGLFLFVILSWMAWETRDWMAHTPLSHLRKLEKYQSLLWVALVGLLLLMALIAIKVEGSEALPLLDKIPFGRGAGMAIFILPLATWAGILLLRPGLSDAKRLVLFWVGTGLLVTLVVEVVVVRGDIGRMNTVFKFYLQVWALFAISAAAALGWLLQPLERWHISWRWSWKALLGLLVFAAALFPLLGGMAKIKDRMNFYEANRLPGVGESLPLTLDGMEYMQYGRYQEALVDMDLSADYRAIRWMQENVEGSPVIVEANSRNLYRWYSRFTINTGLPGVVGWEWHQQQQRALNPPDWVTRRVTEIEQFYLTTDGGAASDFLEKYAISYIVVGQLEYASYPGPGLDKFPAFNGVLWNEVYRDGETAIYEVIK